ncbi:MAG: glycosyltransferase family 2 protein [Bacteroidota bacterium]|nr:glycosyltransferase family 2 protein [Bacteroidota bacterium]
MSKFTNAVSIVIPVYNKIEIIENCILLNINHSTLQNEWILIDNHSNDDTKIGLLRIQKYCDAKGHQCIIITETENTGVAKAWNKGISLSNQQYVCILNNDCVMMPAWDKLLIQEIELQRFHIISPLVLESEMFRKPYGLNDFLKGEKKYDYYSEKNKNNNREGFFGGVVIFAKKATFEKVGNFDEQLWLSLEEMDYLYRAQKMGLITAMIGEINAFHLSGLTRNTMKWDGGNKNQLYFEQKWGWNYEKEENRWYNRWIKRWQRYVWRYMERFSGVNLILPK